MSFWFHLDEPCHWALTDAQGRVTDAGVVPALSELHLPPRAGPVIGVVPGQDVLFQQAQIPGRRRKNAAAAAPFALEEQLSQDVNRLHFTVVDWQRDGNTTIAVVGRETLRRWLDRLNEVGLGVDVLIPETLLLPRHPQTRTTIIRRDAKTLLVRQGDLLGTVLDDHSLALWWRELDSPDSATAVNDTEIAAALVEQGARNVNHWPVGLYIEDWLREDPQRPILNLLHGDFPATRERRGGRRLWPAAAALLLAGLVQVGITGYELYRLRAQHNNLLAQTRNLYKQTFPEARRIDGNIRQYMERRVASLRAGGAGSDDFTYLLGVVARSLSGSGTRLGDLNYRDSGLIVACTLNNFAALEALKKRFEQHAGVQATLLSSGSQDRQVTARFRLQRTTG